MSYLVSYQEIKSLVGLDGKPIKTPEDFKRHEVYCTAKIAMHQAMIDALTPTYERLKRELGED